MTKILLVEDDKSLSEIYRVRLQAEGYEIVSAGDGEAALAVAIKERPLLIVSDVMMPKISGFDMLDILRSTTETKDIKVIMMTALSSEDQRARGEALGANRYLVKSQVGIEDVVRTVHEVLGDSIAATPAAPSFPPVSAPAPAPVAFTEPVAPTPAPAPVVEEPAVAPVFEFAPAPAPVAPTEPAFQPAAYTPPAPTPPVLNSPPVVEAPAPVAAPAYTEPVAPAPAPAYTEPTVPQPVVTPAPAPAPVPEPIAAPAAPFAPAPNPLPQPTAPFSTDRPASLGDRVIHPLPSADNLDVETSNIGNQISQELNNPQGPTGFPPAQNP